MAKGGKKAKRPRGETNTAPGTSLADAEGSSGPAANGKGADAEPGAGGGGHPNEVRFGKQLASSDKSVRDRTVEALQQWLRKRNAGGVLSELDLLKIWRGLWYCMFMCDKAAVQLELGQRLAGLIHVFRSDPGDALRFLRFFCITMRRCVVQCVDALDAEVDKVSDVLRFPRSFCVTLCRDWGMIDYHRLDKYLSLVRLFVREAFRLCHSSTTASPIFGIPEAAEEEDEPSVAAAVAGAKRPRKAATAADTAAAAQRRKGSAGKSSSPSPGADDGAAGGWDGKLLAEVVEVVEKELLLPGCPNGLRYHLADLWAEELCSVGGDLGTGDFLEAFAPWQRLLGSPRTDAALFRRVLGQVIHMNCNEVQSVARV